ncbi:sugar-binding domain-containing protein [uncultured Arcticibacterium sp.]|uniref:glycoside hydrolase family 2 protein n=1 Tax=uncultured Arcticibacterium sp. TaxID=2173042 RepID=UPI0030F8C4F5
MKSIYVLLAFFIGLNSAMGQSIPLPEHPRPDFERPEWQNLNGIWEFEFDSLDVGLNQNWTSGNTDFSKEINVPFPWGSKLSGVADEADIAWYKKSISVSENWKGKRTFFTIGASDWETTVWLDGKLLGKHEGGYTPFSFDLTEHLTYGKTQSLVIRVDDARRMFTLYGKQGYGNARGIWQTAYLEARGATYLDYLHFIPDIDKGQFTIKGELGQAAMKDEILELTVAGVSGKLKTEIKAGQKRFEATFNLANARLWSIEDPYLYDVTATVADDKVKSYFGMRKISVTNLPGTDIPYVALNNKPLYLQLTLDQSYHPDGFYTFPTDEFMKNEIQLCKDIGLNGLRTHIKIDIPRKLYWADKLGLLVMADLPNSWGEPDADAQKESEYTLREMIKRDFNHPSIFSWITFNETWGLRTDVKNEQGKIDRKYLPKTQYWVASMYYLAKSLDETRLVEDNSICCGAGHTETDINSWHSYLPGYEWEAFMSNLDKNTFAGSTADFEDGFAQGNQPMINSECGNVWGYDGSTGDIDWSYDYHRMMNVFRQHPKMAGWLYTEHHDVINEWNGYWRFDRTMKYTGLNEIVKGMEDKDFHSLFYVSTGQDITQTAKAGSIASVPIYLSCHTGEELSQSKMTLEYQVTGIDALGNNVELPAESKTLDYTPWMQKREAPLSVKMPEMDGLYTVSLILKDMNGRTLHHNFMNFKVSGGISSAGISVLEVSPKDTKNADWSVKSWAVMDGLKMNGTGNGSFEYVFSGEVKKAKSAYLLMELGAKELFAKDRGGIDLIDMDYMLGAIAEPSQNKNSYPMTDETKFPSKVAVSINGVTVKNVNLEDDPADHRGILSWHSQKEDRLLHEAGSYGYMVKIPLTKSQLKSLKKDGELKVKLSVKNGGGLAVYGKDFGRYPFNPSIVLSEK